jgi:predicted secreted protein
MTALISNIAVMYTVTLAFLKAKQSVNIINGNVDITDTSTEVHSKLLIAGMGKASLALL